MWDLRWTNWHWDRFFPSSSVFLCQYHSTMDLHTHISSGEWKIGPLVAAVRRHGLTKSTLTTTLCVLVNFDLRTFKLQTICTYEDSLVHLPLHPRFAGSNPGEAIKIHSMPSFRGEAKLLAPCHKTSCNIWVRQKQHQSLREEMKKEVPVNTKSSPSPRSYNWHLLCKADSYDLHPTQGYI
jgi:hypothetical protein